jgi:hypothetical protein
MSTTPTPWRECPKQYTFMQLEAALGVWEHLIECKQADDPEVSEWFNDYGWVNMRLSVAPRVACMALDLYEASPEMPDFLTDELGWSYDWDYLPWVVQQVIRLSVGRDHDVRPVFPPLDVLAARLRRLGIRHG